jgi:hypothetical protein
MRHVRKFTDIPSAHIHGTIRIEYGQKWGREHIDTQRDRGRERGREREEGEKREGAVGTCVALTVVVALRT